VQEYFEDIKNALASSKGIWDQAETFPHTAGRFWIEHKLSCTLQDYFNQ